MNLRRALVRISIAAGLVWLVGWIVYAWSTCEINQISGQQQSGYVTFCEYLLFSYTGSGHWPARIHSFTLWNYTNIVLTGISAPVVALILGWAAWWAAKGFRRGRNPN
jgi:hypothetical protein